MGKGFIYYLWEIVLFIMMWNEGFLFIVMRKDILFIAMWN